MKDEQTLKDYKIEDGVTVHLVKGKSTTGSSAPTTASTESTGASVGGQPTAPPMGMPGMGMPPPMGGMPGMFPPGGMASGGAMPGFGMPPPDPAMM